MLLSAWLIASSIALAAGLLSKVKRLAWGERLAASVPFGLAIGTWAALASALLLQQTGWLSAALASLVLTIGAGLLLRGQKLPKASEIKAGLLAHKALFVLLIIGALGFGLLLSTHVLEERDGATYSAGSTWGDLAIHLSFINSFTRGANALPVDGFPTDPTYAGSRLSYPLLPDYNAAALAASGASIRNAIIVPSLLLFLSLIALLYFFALRFTARKDAAAAAVAIAILAGGIGFLQFPPDFAASGQYFETFVTHLPHDYVHSAGKGHDYYWLSLVNDLILPQRSALFAFPLSMAIFLLLWTAIGEANGERKQLFLAAGAATGLLPFLQGHAFIAVAIVSASVCLLTAAKPFEKHLRDWLWFFAPAAVLGGPQMLWFAGQASAWGFARFQPAWQGSDPLSFWLSNLGLFAVLAFVGVKFLDRKQAVFYAGFLTVFLAANLFTFQPWAQDNTKLFYQWAFAAAAVAALAAFKVGEMVAQKIGGKKARPRPSTQPKSAAASARGSLFGTAIALLLIALMIASGTLALLRESSLHYQFHTANDIAVGEWIAANTPKDAVILTSDWHAQPAATVGGRTLVMGYRGWLWSHGFDYGQREKDVRQMLSGGIYAIDLIEKYDVSYAVIGQSETREYGADKNFFNSHYKRVYTAGGYVVYEITRVQ